MNILKKTVAFGLAIVASSSLALAADLPKASTLISEMGFGFNIGNSMEVPNDPTAWGNPFPTAPVFAGIKAAGFSTVRIPCAWDTHASKGVINSGWLDSVKTVVDLAIAEGLYVILNIHHENPDGWFQNNIGTTVDDGINTKLQNYWTQIANKFKNYDQHLLFAGANEPGPNVKNWTAAHVSTLMSYYKTFIDAVRATGGNNATRTLIIQGLNTDIDKSVANAPSTTFPTDNVEGRLMFEVHYYDPYQFTLMEKEQDWDAPNNEMIIPQFFYGADFIGTDPKRNAGYNAWTGKADASDYTNAHVRAQFKKMKENYADKGYPVIVGEFGANVRTPDVPCTSLEKHLKGRVLWHKDVAAAAKEYGLVPILWDMGNEADQYDNMAYIRRQSKYGTIGQIVDLEAINAIREAYGLSALTGSSFIEKKLAACSDANQSIELTYKAVRNDTNEVGTLRISVGGANWSNYNAVSFVMKTNVTDAPLSGADYGWHTISIFEMSGDWVWSDFNLKDTEESTSWTEYKVPFGANGLDFTKPNNGKVGSQSKVMALGLNVYGTGLSGTIVIDEVRLYKADGSYDVLQDFNKGEPEIEGVVTAKRITTDAGATNAKVVPLGGTSSPASSNSAAPASSNSNKPGSSNSSNNSDAIAAPAIAQSVHFAVEHGAITATFNAISAGRTTVSLMNSLGQVIASKNVNATRGTNSVSLETSYQGTAFLVIRQGSQKMVKTVRLK